MIQYAITDRRSLQADERKNTAALCQQLQTLANSHVDFLQLREKDLSPPHLLALARSLRAAHPSGRPRILLNAPAALAAAAAADGVHLPGGWTPADLTAAISAFDKAGLPPPVLSVAAHTLPEVHRAREAHADLILFGPVFEKRVRGTLVCPGLGLEILAQAAYSAGNSTLLALGGVTPETSAACLAAGADGVAGIRLFLPQGPPAF